MDCTKIQRRPGMENGPSQFHKILKYSLLVAIDDPKTSYIDCFGYIGSECHSFNVESYKAHYANLTATMQDRDRSICVGGDMRALPILVSEDLDLIIKISPCLSRGPIVQETPEDHSNYVTGLSPVLRSKIVHFGILDYTNAQAQVDTVLHEDKAKVMFLDKLGQTNAKTFADLIRTLGSQTKLAVVVDCESLTPDYFPGVSDPSVFGLVEAEIFSMLETLGKSEANIRTLLFANFNPAVESRRSADCLLYMIYSFLQSAKTKGASVLPAMAN